LGGDFFKTGEAFVGDFRLIAFGDLFGEAAFGEIAFGDFLGEAFSAFLVGLGDLPFLGLGDLDFFELGDLDFFGLLFFLADSGVDGRSDMSAVETERLEVFNPALPVKNEGLNS
jgi:hypothetical protein